ncbi:MAG: PHP-associated domain-containing protein [Dehalococcoidia bacterium]|nr:PHP-associated domain-containing protein [Dehalococcoidia bacterium]
MGKADIHIHSAVGDGMAGPQEILDYVEANTDLSVIAVTDHDDLTGGLKARELWARGRYRFEVIAGIELTTLEGHLIALFLEEPVAPLRPVMETLEAVHRQGGLCIIPHPMNWLTRSISEHTIERIMLKRGTGVYFDAIQIANSGPGSNVNAGKALRLNRERYHLPEVGGSDAHFLPVIGAALTEFPGETAADLRRAILEGTTGATNGRYPSLSEIGYRRFLLQQWRGFSVTPRKAGWLPTIASFVKRWRPR